MVLERLMGRWLDSAKKHLRESMVISYRIVVARAVRYLGARELVSLSDAEQQMESRGCLKRRTPSSASRRTEARSTTTASPT